MIYLFDPVLLVLYPSLVMQALPCYPVHFCHYDLLSVTFSTTQLGHARVKLCTPLNRTWYLDMILWDIGTVPQTRRSIFSALRGMLFCAGLLRWLTHIQMPLNILIIAFRGRCSSPSCLLLLRLEMTQPRRR